MTVFDRVARPRVLRAAGASTLLLAVGMLVLGAGLRTPAAPLGIVSLQLAGDVAAAERIVASWSERALAAGLVAHSLDVLFPIAYGFLLVGGAARLRARGPAGRWPLVAAGAAIVAAVADQVENVAMLPTLLGLASELSVRVTFGAAVMKFTALAIALVVLALVMVRGRLRRFRNPVGHPVGDADQHLEHRSSDT
jgi:hypothetical protein